jgi:phospholipid transport system transporter-binding protein
MITQEGNRCTVKGPVTMANAKTLLDGGLWLFSQGAEVVDFEKVTELDSALVSVMLAWVRDARKNGRKLQFIHLPKNLESLAATYGVLEMIPRGQ